MAHSGAVLAQSTIVVPGDEAPRSRLERSAPDAGPQRSGPSRAERPAGEEPGATRSQRGAQSEELRGQGAREREQGQRERQGGPADNTRAQEQRRGQEQQNNLNQAQRDRQEERAGRKEGEQRPETRPAAPQSAQPQQPENRSSPSGTAQQGETQRSGSTAQRQSTPDTAPAAAKPAESPNATAAQQPAGERSEAETRRIADTVRARVERDEIKPVENFGVSVSVGAELPARVQLQPLPSEIASMRPQYRDYRYTVSEREIVIVDPRSRRIVEVIARDGSRTGRVDVYTAFEQRRDVRRWRRPTTVEFEEGVVLPSDAPYYDLPTEVVERNPSWRGYRYVMTEHDEVAIVEPRSHRIVEVVEKSEARPSGSASVASTASRPVSDGPEARHAIVRIIMQDARPGDIQGVDGLRGAVLPPDVVLRPIPSEAAEQDRQLRGRHYALLGDDVLIVDPQSREVVDVIE